MSLGKLVATGKIAKFVEDVAFGEFLSSDLGFHSIDLPVSPQFHVVGDDIKWYSGDKEQIIIMGDKFMSIIRINRDGTVTDFEMSDGVILDRDMNIVADYNFE